MTKIDSDMHGDDATPIPPSRLAEFFAFIKSARSFKGDLSGIAAPAFILSPISLTEFPSYYCEDPSLFIAPSKQQTPALRCLAVLQWYLRTLRAHWVRRRGMKKKPLNPILGELFLGHWEDEGNGRTELLVEQVSHHPPITAYRIRNEKHGVTMEGYHLQKTFFRGRPCIERIGQMILHLDAFEEDYLITLPGVHLEGLIPPPPYPELEGKSFIVGSNGLMAEVDYSGRGWLRGKKNSFHAKVYQQEQPKTNLFTLEGQWSGGEIKVHDSSGKRLDRVDTEKELQLPSIVLKPIEEQDQLESRRVWHKVAVAIEKGDLGVASREKNKLEEDQRILRKKEKAEGLEWQPRYFEPGEWEVAERLLSKIGKDIRRDDTKGIWRWNGEQQKCS
ncbi:Oxysterol binding protein [Cladophialophora chaetospira]|uniref:Oxysterol binding protein n=1 Tax=Cladophialophora chaetospira TaxID=386627 RepID=A0AA39CFE3_9EURO|nr:Oxysterol binding protein [Cladophialophora chaetospira]